MPSIHYAISSKLRRHILKSLLGITVSLCLVIFTTTAGTLFLQGCSSGKNKSDYKTVRAAQQTFTLSVTALGTVKPQVGAEVRLGARIPGKVEHLYANVGNFVEKGQIIAELEKDELKATVEKQQSELNVAKINLETRSSLGPIEIMKAETDLNKFKATYELMMIEFESEKMLFNENFTSKQALDYAREALLVAKAEYESSSKTLELARNKLNDDLRLLNAEVERARAALKIAETELSYATLSAPIRGIIASVSTQEGETVAVGLSAPTFVTIIDIDRLQIETYVDEVDIGKIKVGQKATFIVEAFPSVDIEGEVVGFYPNAVLRENVVFYNVIVKSLKPPSVELRPEMTANVSIFLESRENVLVVPVSAVKKTGGVNFVYAIEDGKPITREVKIGWKQGRFLEITEGLKEGDEILEDQSSFEGGEI